MGVKCYMKNILVVGSFMTDLVIQSTRFVKEGETIIGSSFHQFSGGKGANQAVAAARLGLTVEMIGEIGDDAFGREHLVSLDHHGINHNNVIVNKEVPTGVGNPQIDASGKNRIVVIPGANLEIEPNDIDNFKASIANSDIVILQLEIPLSTVYRTIELAHKYKKIIILNPAPAQKIDVKYAPLIDYIIPNEHESEVLAGVPTKTKKEVETGANNLTNHGYKNVIVTLGDKGAYFTNGEYKRYASAYEAIAKDTTAAGDSFIGAFAYGIANNWNIHKTMQFACACASLTVTKLGAQPSLPYKQEVDRFLNRQ